MNRFARARKRILILTAAAALCASTGAVVAALILTLPATEPERPAPRLRDLGSPAMLSPADDAFGPPCDDTPGVCAAPSLFR